MLLRTFRSFSYCVCAGNKKNHYSTKDMDKRRTNDFRQSIREKAKTWLRFLNCNLLGQRPQIEIKRKRESATKLVQHFFHSHPS